MDIDKNSCCKMYYLELILLPRVIFIRLYIIYVL